MALGKLCAEGGVPRVAVALNNSMPLDDGAVNRERFGSPSEVRYRPRLADFTTS
jgi:hypothetical protein